MRKYKLAKICNVASENTRFFTSAFGIFFNSFNVTHSRECWKINEIYSIKTSSKGQIEQLIPEN